MRRTGNRYIHPTGRDASFGPSAYASFLFTHLLNQIMKTFVVLSLGDRAVRQKFGQKSFLPQEKLMVLFFISQLFSCQAFDCKVHGACHPFRIVFLRLKIRIAQMLSNKKDFALSRPPANKK
jgi:hypothetical protein